MKKISNYSNKVRENNKNFFILEKYNNDIQESILKSLSMLEAEAKKHSMSVFEYANVLLQITKGYKNVNEAKKIPDISYASVLFGQTKRKK